MILRRLRHLLFHYTNIDNYRNSVSDIPQTKYKGQNDINTQELLS